MLRSMDKKQAIIWKKFNIVQNKKQFISQVICLDVSSLAHCKQCRDKRQTMQKQFHNNYNSM